MSEQTELLKRISKKVRDSGVKPFTTAFGTAMKKEFAKLKRSKKTVHSKSKSHKPKPKSTKRKSNKTSKRKSNPTKSVAKNKGGKKKGTSGMTRLKKFLLGIGVGSAVSTIAFFARQPAVESSGPVIDALAGGGWEAQVGTAIPRLIRQLGFQNGANGGNGGGMGGA